MNLVVLGMGDGGRMSIRIYIPIYGFQRTSQRVDYAFHEMEIAMISDKSSKLMPHSYGDTGPRPRRRKLLPLLHTKGA